MEQVGHFLHGVEVGVADRAQALRAAAGDQADSGSTTRSVEETTTLLASYRLKPGAVITSRKVPGRSCVKTKSPGRQAACENPPRLSPVASIWLLCLVLDYRLSFFAVVKFRFFP